MNDNKTANISGLNKASSLLWQSATAFLFSLYLAQRIVLSMLGQESSRIIGEFCLYIFALILLQTGLCWLVARGRSLSANNLFRRKSRKSRNKQKASAGKSWFADNLRRRLPLLAFPAMLTFNILGLFLSYTEFAGLFILPRLLVLAVLFFALLELFRRGGRPVFIGLALLCVSANVEVGVQVWQKLQTQQTIVEDWRAAFPHKFRKIQFTHKPNVYLVSWDSLVPEKIAEVFLSIAPGTLEYARFLKDENFRVFRNAFVDRTAWPTPNRAIDPFFGDGSRAFHNSLLNLDPNMWEKLSGGLPYFHRGYDFSGQAHYFAGRRPSPLFELFKENGYRILVSYDREYFGAKGPYIDKYLIPGKNEGQCVFALSWYYFQSAGFCHIRRLFADAAPPQEFSPQLRALLPVLRSQVRGQPTLNFIYINSPGHTNLNYRHENLRQRRQFHGQIISRAKQTARYMESIISAVRGQDPQAIVLFSADHGAATARGMNKQDMADVGKRNFYFLDIHAAVVAMYPADTCASHMNFSTKYVTTAMIVRRLLVCLADGEDPIDWEVDYSSPYQGVYFADYLYE